MSPSIPFPNGPRWNHKGTETHGVTQSHRTVASTKTPRRGGVTKTLHIAFLTHREYQDMAAGPALDEFGPKKRCFVEPSWLFVFFVFQTLSHTQWQRSDP